MTKTIIAGTINATTSFNTPPINIANRLAGVTRKRSIMPLFKSKTINHPAPIPEPNANRTNIPGTNISKTSAVLMAGRDIFFNNGLNNKIYKKGVINPENTQDIGRQDSYNLRKKNIFISLTICIIVHLSFHHRVILYQLRIGIHHLKMAWIMID